MRSPLRRSLLAAAIAITCERWHEVGGLKLPADRGLAEGGEALLI
jgi:hypothetical protein